MILPETYFGGASFVAATAPGRVNLLGEHTDYNDGYMLPCATPQRTEVLLSASDDGHHQFYSANLDVQVRFACRDTAPPGFGRYIEGCIRMLEERSIAVPPLRAYVRSSVPLGAGLSSSAALEIATLRALRLLLGFSLDDVTLALMGQQAEIRYAQVNCGVMDQMASSLADEYHMLLLDARTLQHELLDLPNDSEVLVIDSGVARTLAGSKYNERRAECEHAARLLGVASLRDVCEASLVEGLPEPYRRRARHVVRENQRVLQACGEHGPVLFGQLMAQSHASLRDDYEVSIPALDDIVLLMSAQSEVYGARLTGAGFGGACVALCRKQGAARAGAAVVQRYGNSARVVVPLP